MGIFSVQFFCLTKSGCEAIFVSWHKAELQILEIPLLSLKVDFGIAKDHT
jgi:hypothetical protein